MDDIIDVTPTDDKMAKVVNIDSALPENSQKKRKLHPNSLANLKMGANEYNGRKSVPAEYKNLIVQYTVPALMTVINIMQDESAKKADRLKAAEMLLERAYGKAVQPVIADVNTNSLVIRLEGQLADWAK